MKGMPNMGKLMKQAQQLQAKMAKMQDELAEKTVEAYREAISDYSRF